MSSSQAPWVPSPSGTLADRVAGQLRDHIQNKVYAVGDRLPSTGELCSLFGVSHITVTAALRVLREEGLVESRRRSGVFVLEPEVQPKGWTQALACLVPSLRDDFFTQILSGVESVASRVGYRLITASSHGLADREAQAVRELAGEVDGLLVFPLSNCNNAVYNGLMDEGVPLVFVDHSPEGLVAPLICADDEGGARMATRHLIETGHRRIWFLTQSLGDITSVDERFRGYKVALKESGLPFDPNLVLQGSGAAGALGLRLTEQFLEREKFEEPVGVFVLNDAMVRGCYLGLREKGLRCPEDVAVACFGEGIGPYLDPPVSSVSQPLATMGERAAELLLEICRGGKPARMKTRTATIRLPSSFTVRGSTDRNSTFSAVGELRNMI